MDIWRIILAITQVATAAAHHEIVVFNEVESAPMARFHGIGQVFPDALYGHIFVTFDVALLRQEIKELQEGISYRQDRAPPEHRGLTSCWKRTWWRATRSSRTTWTSS
jgi:hypothetical protein